MEFYEILLARNRVDFGYFSLTLFSFNCAMWESSLCLWLGRESGLNRETPLTFDLAFRSAIR